MGTIYQNLVFPILLICLVQSDAIFDLMIQSPEIPENMGRVNAENLSDFQGVSTNSKTC